MRAWPHARVCSELRVSLSTIAAASGRDDRQKYTDRIAESRTEDMMPPQHADRHKNQIHRRFHTDAGRPSDYLKNTFSLDLYVSKTSKCWKCIILPIRNVFFLFQIIFTHLFLCFAASIFNILTTGRV